MGWFTVLEARPCNRGADWVGSSEGGEGESALFQAFLLASLGFLAVLVSAGWPAHHPDLCLPLLMGLALRCASGPTFPFRGASVARDQGPPSLAHVNSFHLK